MLDLLYAGVYPLAVTLTMPSRMFRKYYGPNDWSCDLNVGDLTTMLLLIAVAEGETL